MRLKFRPVDSTFYDLFSESAQHLVVGADLLAEMLGADGDREDIARRMRDAEHAADETTHAIIRRVNSTFVTPFDREDIYSLASGLDDVMDMMDEVVDLVLLYEVKELPAELSTQVDVIQRCAEITAEAMPKLQAMKDLDEYWIEINRLENAATRTTGGSSPGCSAESSRRSRCSSSRTSSSPSKVRSTPSRRSRTSWSRSRSRRPDPSMELAIIIAVVVVALVFDYTNGFHDAANAIATSVSTRALTPRVALAMAAVMNFVGAFLGPGGGARRSPRSSTPEPGRTGWSS